MCLLCIEIAKENIKPKDFWRNYQELLRTDPGDHWREVVEKVKKTSPEYQKELSGFWGDKDD
jgi:hypothetical protein